MARQTFYLAREQRHPLYKTRMLQAGPIELDASAARLFQRLGVEMSDEAPKSRRAGDDIREDLAQLEASPEHQAMREEMRAAPKPAAKKAAPKRTTRRKK